MAEPLNAVQEKAAQTLLNGQTMMTSSGWKKFVESGVSHQQIMDFIHERVFKTDLIASNDKTKALNQLGTSPSYLIAALNAAEIIDIHNPASLQELDANGFLTKRLLETHLFVPYANLPEHQRNARTSMLAASTVSAEAKAAIVQDLAAEILTNKDTNKLAALAGINNRLPENYTKTLEFAAGDALKASEDHYKALMQLQTRVEGHAISSSAYSTLTNKTKKLAELISHDAKLELEAEAEAAAAKAKADAAAAKAAMEEPQHHAKPDATKTDVPKPVTVASPSAQQPYIAPDLLKESEEYRAAGASPIEAQQRLVKKLRGMQPPERIADQNALVKQYYSALDKLSEGMGAVESEAFYRQAQQQHVECGDLLINHAYSAHTHSFNTRAQRIMNDASLGADARYTMLRQNYADVFAQNIELNHIEHDALYDSYKQHKQTLILQEKDPVKKLQLVDRMQDPKPPIEQLEYTHAQAAFEVSTALHARLEALDLSVAHQSPGKALLLAKTLLEQAEAGKNPAAAAMVQKQMVAWIAKGLEGDDATKVATLHAYHSSGIQDALSNSDVAKVGNAHVADIAARAYIDLTPAQKALYENHTPPKLTNIEAEVSTHAAHSPKGHATSGKLYSTVIPIPGAQWFATITQEDLTKFMGKAGKGMSAFGSYSAIKDFAQDPSWEGALKVGGNLLDNAITFADDAAKYVSKVPGLSSSLKLCNKIPGVRYVMDAINIATSYGKGAEAVGAAWGGALGSAGGMAGGAAIGTMIFPGVGTVVGGLVGAIACGELGGVIGSKINSLISSDSPTATEPFTGRPAMAEAKPNLAEPVNTKDKLAAISQSHAADLQQFQASINSNQQGTYIPANKRQQNAHMGVA